MAWNSPPVHPCPLHLINPYLTQTFCDGWKRPPVAVVTQVASGGVIQGQRYHHTPQWQYMFFWGFCTGEISKFSVIVRQGWCRLCDKPRRKKTQAALKYQMLICFFSLYRRIKNLKMQVRAMQSMFLKNFFGVTQRQSGWVRKSLRTSCHCLYRFPSLPSVCSVSSSALAVSHLCKLKDKLIGLPWLQ